MGNLKKKKRILICGMKPPPFLGPAVVYQTLLDSAFKDKFDVAFINMLFARQLDKFGRPSWDKFLHLIGLFFTMSYCLIFKRPDYILYGISFDKNPFLKDCVFICLARVFKIDVVLHDMGHYLPSLYYNPNFILKQLVKWLIAHTTSIIVLGEVVKKEYSQFLDVTRIFAVHFGIKPSSGKRIKNNHSDSKSQNNIIHIMYLSFLIPNKGLFTALESIPRVVKEMKNIKFTFAGKWGSATIREESFAYAKKERIDSFVEFLGAVNEEEKRELYAQSDIFIFPTHRDVFGIVNLEAMEAGLPIIASSEGAIPEIIEDGINGFLIPKANSRALAEKILYLAKNSELREKIRINNKKKFYEHYTDTQYALRMMDAFENIEKLNRGS